MAETVTYDVASRICEMTFEWSTTLAKYGRVFLRYCAVPIMYEGQDDHQIGEDIRIVFCDHLGHDYDLDAVGSRTHYEDCTSVAHGVADAFKESDYLIVTNPHNVAGMYGAVEADKLFQKMAELAIARDGVLGYFNGQVQLHTVYSVGDQIACGNVMHDVKEEILIADEGSDVIRIYNAAYEKANISVPDLDRGDVLLSGNVRSIADGAEPLDEIAVIKPDGGSNATVFRYDRALPEWTSCTLAIPYDPDEGDQAICGDLYVSIADNREEIVICNQDGWIRAYDADSGVNIRSLNTVYAPGDHVACGDLFPDQGDEVVIGRLTANEVVVYNGHSGDLLTRFDHTLSDLDHVFVCEEGVAVADASANWLGIWRPDPGGAHVIGGFDCPIHADDEVLVARVLCSSAQQFLFARPYRHDHNPPHDIEIYTYSPYNGTESPGDRYTLDALINPGGLWAEKMNGTWTTSGFLLLVGETEILPAYCCSYYLTGTGRWYVDYTDNWYGNTADDMKQPEIAVGRIPGNSVDNMLIPLETSLAVERGDVDFDSSHAYCVSGATEERHERARHGIVEILEDRGFTVARHDEPNEDTFIETSQDKDAIYLVGHGSPHGWYDFDADTINTRFDPGGSAPLVFAASCLTGRYPQSARTFGERYLRKGASAFIGATEVSFSPWNRYLSEGFFDSFGPAAPLGLTLKNAKTMRMGDRNYGKYQSAIYHFFGDPKLELQSSWGVSANDDTQDVGPLAAPKSLDVQGPISSVLVNIPAFTVDTFGDKDDVRIPGGAVFAQPDYHEVPLFPVRVHLPAGYRVQNVTLHDKGGFSSGMGLDLPMAIPEQDGHAQNNNPPPVPEIWPTRDLDWRTEKRPDGSSILHVDVYPFKYAHKSTCWSFFDSCRLQISHGFSHVSINKLTTDRPVYPLGEAVSVDMYAFYPRKGDGIDVIAEARIAAWDSMFSEGLEVKRLKNLQGLGTCNWTWNPGSTQAEAGSYEVQVQLRTPAGILLDSATVPFSLGIAKARIVDLSVRPPCFSRQEDITLAATVFNAGDTSLSGKCIIEAQDRNGRKVAHFEQDIAGVLPGAFQEVRERWTARLPRGSCRFVAYLLYDGKRTAIQRWPSVSPACDGDLNQDGQIDLGDISDLGRYWLTSSALVDIAPVGGDCMVDFADLRAVVEHWLEGSEP